MNGPIYEPTGRALEYSYLALNLYTGCSHGCSYCYGPGATRKSRTIFHTDVRPRPGVIEALRRQAPKLAGTNKRVLLCFTCDPYCDEAVDSGVTRQALTVLRDFDIPFQVLTKGGMRATTDFDLYGPYDAFATTLTCVDSLSSVQHEPYAPLPSGRIQAIKRAFGREITTWVSLEPVLYPDQSLALIRLTTPWVKLFKLGKLNHDPQREAQIDWRAYGQEAIRLCERFRVPYLVKKDLAAHLQGLTWTDTEARVVTR